MDPPTLTSQQAPSPARSDKSSDSEGRPVRQKLKETRIDAKGAPDHTMEDASTNGTNGDSYSGSDSDRGRLRRKRSREDFEADEDTTKQPEKKQERHTRKKSRDVTSPVGSDFENAKVVKPLIPSIREDEHAEPPRSTARKDTPEAGDANKKTGITSPKNKRTRDQAETEASTAADSAAELSENPDTTSKTEDERTTKRPRDGDDPATTKSTTKIPPGSGFSNTSAASPFASMSPQKPASKSTEKPAEDLPKTSDQAFKNSGFGSFATSTVSPFGSAAGSGSALGAASGPKLSSFASPSKPAAQPSGFASLGGSSSGVSAFGSGASNGGKPLFGGALGASAFGNAGGASKLSSFGSGGGSITGLTQKPAEFGSKEQPKDDSDDSASDNEDGDETNNSEDQPLKPRQSSLLQPQGPLETGEENEDVTWTGHVKLYTLAGETGKKGWHERGTGTLKVNVTRDEPKKARLVLRADATHRLLLNAAIAKSMRFGDAQGKEPKDGKVLFAAPTATGEVESHLLRLKVDKGIDLWGVVEKCKQDSS
ncbi:hypothetical protein DM02DRAFT_631901 [Periconia macrospinosa]|uniref:RanBD1 domain-containing protein n=1 Tax=Periconia macrospinosa TaxID=97972 RepID=A0A2V1DEX6_9PLEO|nr:hypothetical protein DM02DRAFT_631901 [Periconia macrospinosa]